MGCSEARLASAQELKQELERILAGAPPHDLFIRWKPVHRQPIGWEPDISDGVRLNIRPFMMATLTAVKSCTGVLRALPKGIKWNKDRGTEWSSRAKEDFPWFWDWDEETTDWPGGTEFTGERWNDCHYTTRFKLAARERKAESKENTEHEH